jgi:hypothetical protein
MRARHRLVPAVDGLDGVGPGHAGLGDRGLDQALVLLPFGQLVDDRRLGGVGLHPMRVRDHARLVSPSAPASSVGVGNSLSGPPSTWITTWLAPARRCSPSRSAMLSGVP